MHLIIFGRLIILPKLFSGSMSLRYRNPAVGIMATEMLNMMDNLPNLRNNREVENVNVMSRTRFYLLYIKSICLLVILSFIVFKTWCSEDSVIVFSNLLNSLFPNSTKEILH